MKYLAELIHDRLNHLYFIFSHLILIKVSHHNRSLDFSPDSYRDEILDMFTNNLLPRLYVEIPFK